MAKKDSEKDGWAEEMTLRLEFRVPPSMMSLIDNWRRDQDDLPGRSEAARRLLELALKVEKVRPRK
jgi:hypothetical protein